LFEHFSTEHAKPNLAYSSLASGEAHASHETIISRLVAILDLARFNVPMIQVLAKALVILLAALTPAAHADVAGRTSVIDGDTIEIHGQRIRLFGIDAPESAQLCLTGDKRWRCGQQAALALDDKIAGRPVECAEKDRDQYGRIVAVCRAGDQDLNGWLVTEGWALAYRQFSTDYVDEEEAARAAGKGIWRGTFVPPWDWRRGKRLEPTASKPGDCRIKGNVSSKGERIYHVPGGRFYEQTQIDTDKGERWFCSEAEAKAAGWRRSRR
jgi:endonuclease YncB( thermonuclease family)